LNFEVDIHLLSCIRIKFNFEDLDLEDGEEFDFEFFGFVLYKEAKKRYQI